MVLAYHLIFCMYGFWLPNDPRGSWSTEVWAKNLLAFGKATKTDALPSPWAEHGWRRFLDSSEKIGGAIEYVERNPEKIGMPRQRWGFLTPYAP